MPKKSLFILIAATIAAGTLFASESNSTVTIHTERTSPADGKAMYTSYCAPCHGVDGRGKGPLSSSLKRTPSDLTVLSRNNGGAFPSVHVIGVLGHGTRVSGHEPSSMPDWGSLLGMINQDNKLAAPLRMSNLSRYLETLQAK